MEHGELQQKGGFRYCAGNHTGIRSAGPLFKIRKQK